MPAALPAKEAPETGPEKRAEGEERQRRHEPPAERPRGARCRHLAIREGVQQPGDVIADVLRDRIGPKPCRVQLLEAALGVHQPLAIATGGEVALEGDQLLFGKLLVEIFEEPRASDLTDHRLSWI